VPLTVHWVSGTKHWSRLAAGAIRIKLTAKGIGHATRSQVTWRYNNIYGKSSLPKSLSYELRRWSYWQPSIGIKNDFERRLRRLKPDHRAILLKHDPTNLHAGCQSPLRFKWLGGTATMSGAEAHEAISSMPNDSQQRR